MPSVLIVESEEPLVRLMSWFLIEAGFEVTAVKDAYTALERFPASRPDVIIVNTHLPEPAKRDYIERWRAATRDAKVLDVVDAAPSAPSGADAVLRLPFHADTLIETVQNLISAGK